MAMDGFGCVLHQPGSCNGRAKCRLVAQSGFTLMHHRHMWTQRTIAAHEMHCDDFMMHETSKRMYIFVQFRSTRVPLPVRFVWCKPEVLGRRKEHLWRALRRAQYTRMEQCVHFRLTRVTLPVRFVWCKPEVLGRRKEHLWRC